MKNTLPLRSSVRLLFSALLLGFFAFSAVLAQENTGAIRGTVQDTTGAAIQGAKVTASSPALVRPIDMMSDKDGVYRFPSLPAGVYSITVSQTGFTTSRNEDINVALGSELTLDVALSAGAVNESVNISAAAEAIDVTSSKASTNISEKFIENTPKGRSFNTLLQVAPGVIFDVRAGRADAGATGTSGSSPGGGVGGYSVNGASGSENVFIIDGVEVSNVRNAALGRESAIPFEFIREVQVKSAGFEAEYGGAIGGVVNVITKSGSSAFHGQASLEFTTSALNSRARGFWQRLASDPSKAEFFRQKEDDYRSFFPVFELGGPLMKDRLNFFAAYAPELGYTERSIPFTSGSRTTTQRLTRHYGIARLDYAPTQKVQVNTSYIWTPIRVTGLLTGVNPDVAPPANDLSINGGFTPANVYSASFNYAPNSKILLSARYGYKYLNDKGNTYGLPTAPRYLYQAATSGPAYSGPAVPQQFAGPVGFQNVGSTFQVLKDITTRHTVSLDASYLTSFFGQHAFKGGYSLNRVANEVNDDHINGFFLINWGTGYTRGSKVNERGQYGYYIWQDGIRHNSKASSHNQGFYIQDQWQVVPRVTLNLGVRIEDEFLPPFTPVVDGVKVANPISFGWGGKIAPRFGAAWDALGAGKWKISASYGDFYDVMKYELARTAFGGEILHDRVYKLDDPDITKLSKANPGALGSLIIDINNRTIPINPQGQLSGIDPTIKPTLSREFVVASEHRLWSNFVLSARYTRKRVVRAIEDFGALDAQENEVFIIGNPGFGASDAKKFTAPNGRPLTPKARRDYDSLEFRFDQRFSKGYLRNLNIFGSYTYSRLFGNWAGLANSDEAGRSQPNISRAFDQFQSNFDSKGNNVFGLLPTDRPHALKLFPSYHYSWAKGNATDFSIAQFVASGTPLSSEVLYIVPVFFNGRGDLGRTPVYTQTDLLVAHTVTLSERVKARFSANIINLLNQGAVTSVTTRINRTGGLTLTKDEFFRGFDVNSLLRPVDSSVAPARNPIYNLPSAYQGIREIRLGFRILF
ncbi:MAG TPA: carboxypeptidase regulatory-like domain-containing protein [Blastocatellia bacterium]|nr:carboxypeptidase regulatory-like domain-containing protein [Blastocatellia bacterium]